MLGSSWVPPYGREQTSQTVIIQGRKPFTVQNGLGCSQLLPHGYEQTVSSPSMAKTSLWPFQCLAIHSILEYNSIQT